MFSQGLKNAEDQAKANCVDEGAICVDKEDSPDKRMGSLSSKARDETSGFVDNLKEDEAGFEIFGRLTENQKRGIKECVEANAAICLFQSMPNSVPGGNQRANPSQKSCC